MSSTEKLKTEPYILKYGNFWMRETEGQRKYNAGDTVNLTEFQAKVYKDKIDWSVSKAVKSAKVSKEENKPKTDLDKTGKEKSEKASEEKSKKTEK